MGGEPSGGVQGAKPPELGHDMQGGSVHGAPTANGGPRACPWFGRLG